MLLECCRYILIECPTCKEIKEYDLNYFKFNSEGFLEFQCECGDVNGRVSKAGKENLLVNIHCVKCEKVHIYNLGIERLFNNNSSLSCVSGGRICIVGDRCLIDKIKKNSMGNEENTSDELALLMKKLYTLDKDENILCTCGNTNLTARISSDKLYLTCGDCKKETSISIESSQDLRVLLEKDKIVIGKEESIF